jgi:hypothetical protein
MYDMQTFCIYGMWDLDMAPMARQDTVPEGGSSDMRYEQRSVFTMVIHLNVK